MSSKSAKGKKLSVPRELAEIQKEYQERIFAAGQIQYQVEVLSDELKSLNGRIRSLNHEAAAAKELEAKKQPQEEVTNVQQ
jgi:uncharacterized protein (DUF3084 family)